MLMQTDTDFTLPRPELLNRLNTHPGAEICVITQEGSFSYKGVQILHDTTEVLEYLQSQGVHPGCRVGIRAANSYEWLLLDFALISLGCTSVCIPAGNPELDPLDADALSQRFDLDLLFQDQEFDAGNTAAVQTLSSLLTLAREGTPLTLSKSTERDSTASDIFTVVFSSGTTGRLKRLPISWDSLQIGIEAISDAFNVTASDRIFDILPLSIFQQRYLAYIALYRGGTVILSSQDLFFEALKEGNPTIILGPPAFYELAEQRFERWPERTRRNLIRVSKSLGWLPDTLGMALRKRLFKELHEIYGSSVRVMLVGSAPINLSTLDFFKHAGFPLFQIYGMTECGWIAWNRPGANKIGSVGKPAFPDAISIGPDGDVLVSNPKHLCHSYEAAEGDENTNVFVDPKTISTGDIGAFDSDGFLILNGRKKNIIITAGGQKISPENIEEKVKAIGRIEHVVVFQDESLRALSAAIWCSDTDSAAQGRIARALKALNRKDLSTNPIMGVAFSQTPLSAETGLLTRNLKVDRTAVQNHHASSVKRLGELA
ncbi:Long-chain-fatty-acid--CoA ligase FadD15 [Pelagimonas phthalicica]|uniref:Long-chain-fatty-acid--CoA ligase FadD15 n=2 Tax=Pelagimonas phthalicica TaxID=1037362 RepID=A0A238JDC3_9RHOB|nr:long-subunit acyl-CoA synthetase (AMP-forming) [Pelagimonas phthalicica]SMX28678.1 Long-chain-fatty-acid--CoA ligase FadD15 [Pelagimonas phthalicica]